MFSVILSYKYRNELILYTNDCIKCQSQQSRSQPATCTTSPKPFLFERHVEYILRSMKKRIGNPRIIIKIRYKNLFFNINYKHRKLVTEFHRNYNHE